MLPPGHIAGGYLVGYAFVQIFEPLLSGGGDIRLIYLAMAAAFAPDLDMFFSFAKSGKARLGVGIGNHRLFITHTPVFWIFCGIGIFLILFFLGKPQAAPSALVITLGALSHLVLDSIQYGIQWFYPFSKRLYGICDQGVEFFLSSRGFIAYWTEFFFAYVRRFTLTFILEMILIVAALSVALK